MDVSDRQVSKQFIRCISSVLFGSGSSIWGDISISVFASLCYHNLVLLAIQNGVEIRTIRPSTVMMMRSLCVAFRTLKV